jgi:hypothetical protein
VAKLKGSGLSGASAAALLGTAFALFVLVEVRADPIIYATAGAGKSLVKIDVGARKVSPLGEFGVPGADAIAINAQGQAFTITHGWPRGGDSQLARVDLASGQATAFGTPNKPENFMGLGFAPDGTLYGVNAGSGTPEAGSLYKFNPATGAATKVGVTGGCFDIMDLAWAPDGTMYGAVNDSLDRVDAATGQATLVTKVQGVSRVMGLAIDDLGVFYVSEILTNAPLLRVDPVTGATTKLFDTGVDFVHGLDLAPVPHLSAALVNGQFVLSWPAWASDLVLQASDTLGPSSAWVDWPNAPTVVGHQHSLTVEATAPARFFRTIRR